MMDNENTGMTEKKKMNKALKVTLIVLSVILLLIVLAACAYFILRAVGKSHFKPAVMNVEHVKAVENAVPYDEGKTIKYNGKTYVYNEDIIYVAFMGVDKRELDTEEGVSNSAGQSDTNMIIAVDTASGKMSLIVIPRDSMTDVNIMDAEGERIGTERLQLCLAYSYGDGRERSCENVLRSMERLLYGIEIKNYYSLDLDGIGALNDAVGGVEVTCLETIGKLFTEGEWRVLHGNEARYYVQIRDTSTFNSDALRRRRQIQYAKAFAAKAFAAIKADFSKATELYNVAGDYSCTNFELSRFIYLVSVVLEKHDVFSLSDDDIIVLPGEATMGKRYMEIDLDRSAVFETILNVFYKKAEA